MHHGGGGVGGDVVLVLRVEVLLVMVVWCGVCVGGWGVPRGHSAVIPP